MILFEKKLIVYDFTGFTKTNTPNALFAHNIKEFKTLIDKHVNTPKNSLRLPKINACENILNIRIQA